IKIIHVLLLRDPRQERKRSIQYPAIISTNNQPIFFAAMLKCSQPKTIVAKWSGCVHFAKMLSHIFQRSKYERILSSYVLLSSQLFPHHRSNAPHQFTFGG